MSSPLPSSIVHCRELTNNNKTNKQTNKQKANRRTQQKIHPESELTVPGSIPGYQVFFSFLPNLLLQFPFSPLFPFPSVLPLYHLKKPCLHCTTHRQVPGRESDVRTPSATPALAVAQMTLRHPHLEMSSLFLVAHTTMVLDIRTQKVKGQRSMHHVNMVLDIRTREVIGQGSVSFEHCIGYQNTRGHKWGVRACHVDSLSTDPSKIGRRYAGHCRLILCSICKN